MHFLLTNDDGIDAPGLAALAEALATLPEAKVTIVAPSAEYSQCGHRVTTREPITVNHLGEHRHSVGGTPADCVRIALFALGLRPDYVVSGVNAGGNMGQDLVISGTLAAAREAAFHGIPALALSHYLRRDFPVEWPRISEWSSQLLAEILPQSLADGEFWNINFPHYPPGPLALPARTLCHPCRAPLNVSYESESAAPGVTAFRYSATYAARPVEPNSDVAVCFGGSISVSRLRV